ncbi:hypothetical protein FBU30_004867 [Linnemannia zychae]|nr:hypothetical protein FBU30_004867 [Linnemannia zychae]
MENNTQSLPRKSARIRDRAAARAEREREAAQEIQLKLQKEREKHWRQLRDFSMIQTQKESRAKSLLAARMTTSVKTLVDIQMSTSRKAISGKKSKNDKSYGQGDSIVVDQHSDTSDTAASLYNYGAHSCDDSSDDFEFKNENRKDGKMAMTKRLKGPQRSALSISSSAFKTKIQGCNCNTLTQMRSITSNRFELRDRYNNTFQQPVQTHPRHYNDSEGSKADSYSSDFNFDNLLPIADSVKTAAEDFKSPVGMNEEWSALTRARYTMAVHLHRYLESGDHLLTPLSMVIRWMPRINSSMPVDPLDLWTIPVKSQGTDWDTARVIDILRTDQVAHWLYISVGELLGFLIMSTPTERRFLNSYLICRLDLMRTLQAMPSCLEWLDTNEEPQHGDPIYKILCRFRSLDDELQRLLVWNIQKQTNIRRNMVNSSVSTTISSRPTYLHSSSASLIPVCYPKSFPESTTSVSTCFPASQSPSTSASTKAFIFTYPNLPPFDPRKNRAQFDFLLKTWSMFRARTSPCIEFRASQTAFPAAHVALTRFVDRRDKTRWYVKVDTTNPSMDQLDWHTIDDTIMADHTMLNQSNMSRSLYQQTMMIDDELTIAAQDPRFSITFSAPPIAASTFPATTLPTPISGQSDLMPEELIARGFNIKSTDEWVMFPGNAESGGDNWWRYELVSMIAWHRKHLTPDRLAIESPLLNSHITYLEEGIRREKERLMSKSLYKQT